MRIKRIVGCILGVSIVGSMLVLAGADNTLEALKVNHEIWLDDREIRDKLMYPQLSYEDHIYISLRDFAALTDRDIRWIEKDKRVVVLKERDRESYVVYNEETALEIGKAVLKEKFSAQITETAAFYVTGRIDADHTGAREFFEVYVVFEDENGELRDAGGSTFKTKADAMAYIHCDNGEVRVGEYDKKTGRIIRAN